jgi:hypothetical protein
MTTSPSSQLKDYFNSYVLPPLSVGLSIIPTYYGYGLKTAAQLGEPFHMTYAQACKAGLKAAPILGGTVGLQLITQNAVEKFFYIEQKSTTTIDFLKIFASSFIVAGISSPFLAIFNGKTLGWDVSQSLRRFTVQQAGAIIAREACFLGSLRISEPFSIFFQEKFGQLPLIGVGTTFLTGAFGSLLGHPTDTLLTLWQKNLKHQNFSHLMQGSIPRSLAGGSLFVVYNSIHQLFSIKEKK